MKRRTVRRDRRWRRLRRWCSLCPKTCLNSRWHYKTRQVVRGETHDTSGDKNRSARLLPAARARCSSLKSVPPLPRKDAEDSAERGLASGGALNGVCRGAGLRSYYRCGRWSYTPDGPNPSLLLILLLLLSPPSSSSSSSPPSSPLLSSSSSFFLFLCVNQRCWQMMSRAFLNELGVITVLVRECFSLWSRWSVAD